MRNSFAGLFQLLQIICPPAAAISDITLPDCPESFGQIQKLIFQRKYSTGTTLNTMTIADAKLLANWTPLKTAADGTKVQVSPFVSNPTSEVGEAIEYGGGNQTIGAVPIIVGQNGSSLTAQLLQMPQAVIKSLKALCAEQNLAFYVVNEYGQIGGLTDTAGTGFLPIPAATFFVGDKMFGGKEAPDSNNLKIGLLPGWSDYYQVVSPTDFSALDL